MSDLHPCRTCAEWQAPLREGGAGYCLEWRIWTEPGDGCRRWRKSMGEVMKKYSSRGFRNYAKFKDIHGIEAYVCESSLATQRAVRIYVHDDDHRVWITGSWSYPCLHLSEAQAKRLVVALQKFLEEE